MRATHGQMLIGFWDRSSKIILSSWNNMGYFLLIYLIGLQLPFEVTKLLPFIYYVY
ncbi:protein of unknown function [Candidatus Nitrosocosmicus franklandus]|uniref:Uncharacterized protein n=1 Tax=Candidatus Nitrosocosmicus franklandianus TaxID=1798806 RepID=A0A484I8F8_9ARCH|nr:protein of unknown function [Candidatus Nitrosocosmicus franklandus]